jgi:hypothetical protein
MTDTKSKRAICNCYRPHEHICGAATSNPAWVCHNVVRPNEQCWRHRDAPVFDERPVAGSWGVVTSLPKNRYRITEAGDEWDVWAEAHPSFL